MVIKGVLIGLLFQVRILFLAFEVDVVDVVDALEVLLAFIIGQTTVEIAILGGRQLLHRVEKPTADLVVEVHCSFIIGLVTLAVVEEIIVQGLVLDDHLVVALRLILNVVSITVVIGDPSEALKDIRLARG